MTIVPAVMTLLGRAGLVAAALADRICRNVDVEGEKLRAALDESAREPVGAGR